MNSLLRTIITTVLITLSLSITLVSAHQFSLKSLKTGERSTVLPENELATIAMVYQPDCPWCEKQELLLRKIKHACDSNVNLALIGNKGSARDLKRELKHFSQNLPAYRADSKFLRKIGGVDASPTTLFFDKKGNIIAKKRGYISPEKLFNAVNIITNKSCSI